MLVSMHQPVPAPPCSSTRGFAAILADLAEPEEKSPPARDLDGLADDVANLSYEKALRGRSSNPVASPDETQRVFKSALQHPIHPILTEPASRLTPCVPLAGDARPSTRRCASVTLRLSAQESEQLRHRAHEAGLSVSAYLRSCAFEVETLRAEVKATLAQLRTENDSPKNPVSPRRNWLLLLKGAIRKSRS